MPGWDGDSRRKVNGYIGAPVEAVNCPDGGEGILGWYWGVRGFLASHDDVMTPSIVKDWCEWSGVSLSRREEGILYAMDKAFRKAMPDAIKYHEARREHKRKMEGK